MDHYDVIIIGTGAGGGTLAHRLAPSGKRILLLERGGYLPREPENWDSGEVFGKDRYVTREQWVDKHGEAFRPHAQYYVGGNSKVYGAILFRLRERDFDEVRHHAGISLAWPITYADLEPYYTEAERLYLVHGAAGEDPTEPWRSTPFPYPAVSHETRIQQLHDDFERIGHHPFHLPVGVDLDESDPEGGRCVRCSRFDGFPCLTDGKADAHVRCVRPALEHRNVTLKTHSKVERLETDGSGHSVNRVIVTRHGVEERCGADVVVVSCGAANSAALLLRSASERHPEGLANSSGVVGRHYMAHLNSGVVAISQAPNETKFQKTLGLNDFYWSAPDAEFPLGHIQMLGKSDRNILRAGAPWFAPGVALDYMARHAIDFWLTTEDLPHPDNRVTVDRRGTIHLSKTYQHRADRERRCLPFCSLGGEDDDGPVVDPDRFRPEGDRRPGHWWSCPSTWDTEPDERLLGGETLEVIERAIAELPERQHLVIVMRDVEGWSAMEVCAALAISEANQRVLLHRARSKVRGVLEAYLEPQPVPA